MYIQTNDELTTLGGLSKRLGALGTARRLLFLIPNLLLLARLCRYSRPNSLL
jgi:hypothetical protein